MRYRVVLYQREGDDEPLVEQELRALRELGREGEKDEGRLRAVLERCLAQHGDRCTQLEFRSIKGPPSDGKLWEAKYARSARRRSKDGVHGYRLFYRLTRDPEQPDERIFIILMLWAKSGPDTPQKILDEAWRRYLDAE